MTDYINNQNATENNPENNPESTNIIKNWDDLPVNAQNYISKLEKLCDVPVHIVSTGPERDETILIKHPFD